MHQDHNTTLNETAAQGFVKRRRAWLLCALILALTALNFLTVIGHKSITIDETLMIPAGYYHLTAGDMRPVNEHPPFAKLLGALPLVIMGAHAPAIDSTTNHEYEYYLNLFDNFWRANNARFDAMSFWARVPLICVTLLLGLLVFVYARRLFGERAALLAVALFALEPTVLAHGRVVQTDIPSAFAYLLFCFTLYDYLRAPALRRAVYVGLAAGLAVVTKFSMIVLWPVLVVLFYVLWVRAR
ncbi:MAG: glycosyltransferase family 39 protein, partial [Pyrinomonadaceae bacterium]